VIVVDASVAVKWFVTEEGHLPALRLLDQSHLLIAPDLIFSETANVLWKKLRKGEVTQEQSERACRILPEFFRAVVSSARLIVDAIEIAKRLDHSVYDCVYLACAQETGAKLVTADKRLVLQVKNAGLGHLAIGLDEIASLTQSSDDVLSISDPEMTRVLDLSDRFIRTMAFVEGQVGRPIGGGTIKWVNTADLTPALDSPGRRRLRQALSELSRDNLRDLVALAWLGRGHDGRDWIALRKSAESMLGNKPLEHDGYITSLLSYVQEGIQALIKIRGQRPDRTDPNTKRET
jgi:predicted nucleic acid-binding protein